MSLRIALKKSLQEQHVSDSPRNLYEETLFPAALDDPDIPKEKKLRGNRARGKETREQQPKEKKPRAQSSKAISAKTQPSRGRKRKRSTENVSGRPRRNCVVAIADTQKISAATSPGKAALLPTSASLSARASFDDDSLTLSSLSSSFSCDYNVEAVGEEAGKKSLVNPFKTASFIPTADPRLVELSKKLTSREPLESKPKPRGQPLVWADSRQALCETVPYFKKPQGGCYHNDGHVYGFLFDSNGHCREYMDPDVIICRAGGGMEQDTKGTMVQGKNQSIRESQPQAVLNDIAHRNPFVIICGNRNRVAMCKMPHQYCVLDWYKPVSVWCEKTAGRGNKSWTTVRYRLERLNSVNNEAWHAPEQFHVSEEDRALAGVLSKASCICCKTEYPQVYLIGWMCLNADCGAFWKIKGEDSDCGNLDHNPAFLLDRTRWDDECEPTSLRAPLPNVGKMMGDHLTYINTRGVCCPVCGRCNQRRLFKGWVCETPGCKFQLFCKQEPILPTTLHTPWHTAPTLTRNKYDSSQGIQIKVWHQNHYKITKYTFEGINGCFVHAATTRNINHEQNGPDDMFAKIQVEDMGLQRRTFAIKRMSAERRDRTSITTAQDAAVPTLKSPDETSLEFTQVEDGVTQIEEESTSQKYGLQEGDLMTAFSMNYGMPYKFVATGASKSFKEAPKAIVDCRSRLNWAARTFLEKPETNMEFNEELIFAYLEGQKIEYHDDGEEGLGPRIATLSLGGRAQMHLRMKMKHYVGCSKTGVFTEDEPVPGSIGGREMYEKRHDKWTELQQIKGNQAAYTKRRKEIPKELGLFEKRMKKADDLVTVTLSHGDIVLMDGYDIQKYLEHKVVSEGYLRFALTCRTVLESHLTAEELMGVDVSPETEEERYYGPQIGEGPS